MDLIERGLIRKEGLFIKSSDKDIFGYFPVLSCHTLQNRHTIYRGGGGVLDLNLYGDVPTKKKFHPAPEFLPSNDTLF